jgi:DNA-binding NarL/FixJ family response regulator
VGQEPEGSARVLAVDGDVESRAVVASALCRAGYMTLEASSGEEAIEIARRDPPALVALEVKLPGICGYQVLVELRVEFGAGLPIVFVSGARTEACDRVAGLLLGADDYFVKPIASDEFLLRVRRLIDRSKAAIAPIVASKLTPRELEVLRLLAEGLDGDEIARRLFIARKTVRTHIENIFRKLQVHTRGQAIALAYRQDLLGASV